MAATHKPKYFFLAFGESYAGKHSVDGGVYPHRKGFVGSSEISAGDVMLLYCCADYPEYDQEAPGIGVVTSIDTIQDIIYYQYFPLDNPIDWDIIKASIPELKGNTNFSLTGNWLREISNKSFRAAMANRQISWQ
ncbi:MAG: hypothetical protein WC455_05665 [Dehalococcoidia bacterium]|jgi:hypothetical protein